MAYALSIIEAPNGKFVFVGNVPSTLAVETNDPELIKIGASVGMGIARKIAEKRGKFIRTRTWETREAALNEATTLGYTVA